MNDRILRYLQQTGKPLPADRILRDALSIHSPNSLAADRTLARILGQDPRFHRCRNGLWQASVTLSEREVEDCLHPATLFIEGSTGRSYPTSFRGAAHLPDTGTTWEFRLPGPPEQIRPLDEMRSGLENRLLVVWGARELRLWNTLLASQRLGVWTGETLFLRKLAGRLMKGISPGLLPEDLASYVAIPPPDVEQPQIMARYFAAAFEALVEQVPPEHRVNTRAIEDWVDAEKQKIDFSNFGFGPEFLDTIPASPGVYVMRTRASNILYVGKARNLRNRIHSYFTWRALKDPKVARLHEQLHSLEFLTVESEVEALLLEMRMIRDFQPSINLQTKVHEQPEIYGKRHNLILLVAGKTAEKAEAYFLHQGSFVGQQTVTLGRTPSKKLKSRILSIYFSTRRKRQREPWEMEIVSRWLTANKKRLNFVDIDETGSYDGVLRQLSQYLHDAEKLSRKVYYR